jgi:hypothetical protein
LWRRILARTLEQVVEMPRAGIVGKRVTRGDCGVGAIEIASAANRPGVVRKDWRIEDERLRQARFDSSEARRCSLAWSEGRTEHALGIAAKRVTQCGHSRLPLSPLPDPEKGGARGDHDDEQDRHASPTRKSRAPRVSRRGS